MTNTVLFDLQAAAMAAAANSANPSRKLPNGEDIPEGMNFSDILASQNVQNTQNMQTNAAENAEGKNIPAENAETDAAEETDKGIFSDALKLIENADDGVKKGSGAFAENRSQRFERSKRRRGKKNRYVYDSYRRKLGFFQRRRYASRRGDHEQAGAYA